MKTLLKAIVLAGMLALQGCSDEKPTVAPPPLAMPADATGHYCGMLLAEHTGPKGQILLRSGDRPVWFTSVRDTFTFLALPEEPKDIAAVYVSDMAKAPSWDNPGAENWIAAGEAVYVVESDQLGGMGGAEAVPFGDAMAAQAFVAEHGGRVVPFEEAKAAMPQAVDP
jgi:copper chaperone NosL